MLAARYLAGNCHQLLDLQNLWQTIYQYIPLVYHGRVQSGELSLALVSFCQWCQE